METPTTEQIAKSRVKANRDRAYRASFDINASAEKELPTRVMLMKTGDWSDSWKGNLKITADDLREYKANFEAKIGHPGNGDIGLPIDFSHMDHMKAAAWIKGLEVAESDDPIEAAQGVMCLYSNPTEWTTDGADAIRGGMYKCISPSFYPAGRGGWEDPENMDRHVDNVLVGAGLTNIPFFSGLSPVTASASNGKTEDVKNVIYINATKTQEGALSMTVDQIRIKDAKDLTEDEKKFLADHKAELSGEEQVKFGLVEAANNNDGQISDEDRQLLADIKAGKLKTVKSDESVVNASKVEAMQSQIDAMATTIADYNKRDVESEVDEHVKRGAIKADRRDSWVDRIIAASKEDAEALKEDLKALPSNEALAQELGHVGADASGTTREQIAKLAADKVKAATDKGETLDFVEAQKQVLAENPDLAEADRNANKF